jgi:hypothetical protein
MTADDPDKPKRQPARKKGLGVDMPGFEADVSEETARTFLDHTGDSWRWVVVALAWSVFWGGTCWGLSWLI